VVNSVVGASVVEVTIEVVVEEASVVKENHVV
jgi:hypothetical protein